MDVKCRVVAVFECEGGNLIPQMKFYAVKSGDQCLFEPRDTYEEAEMDCREECQGSGESTRPGAKSAEPFKVQPAVATAAEAAAKFKKQNQTNSKPRNSKPGV